jgi:hypothetical protein
MKIVSTIYRRFLLASILWIAFWPTLWFIKIGEITGPKAWFWIVGELSYPVVAVVYVLIDKLLKNLGLKPWQIFMGAIATITVAMPFYYEKYGFALGVTLEARYL